MGRLRAERPERSGSRVKRTINAFLLRVWRDGALFGATPDEAFYVKCDAETNPPEVVDAGQLIVEIGIAPVKPAEFVVFRIGQFTGGAALCERLTSLSCHTCHGREPRMPTGPIALASYHFAVEIDGVEIAPVLRAVGRLRPKST